MRIRSLSTPLLLCVALAVAPRPSAGQPEPGATTAEPAAAEPAGPAEGAAEGTTESPAEPPAPTEPAATGGQPAQPGWGAQPPQPGWGGQPAQPWGTEPAPGWGTPPTGEQPEWGTPAGPANPAVPDWIPLPEDQQVRSWPLLVTLGVGWGGAIEGSTNLHASAITVEPTVFLGLLKHFGMNHGPSLSLPIGMPGSYEVPKQHATGNDTFSYGVSFAAVPGYQLVHFFRPDMFWGAGLGVPLYVANWRGDPKNRYKFNAGLEVSAQYGYKFLAGLGAFVRVQYDVFFGTFDATTIGGEIGLCMYYDWFRPWEPPAPSAGSQE